MRKGCSLSLCYCTSLCSGFLIFFPQDLKILREKKSQNCSISGDWTRADSWKKHKCLGCSRFIMAYFSCQKKQRDFSNLQFRTTRNRKTFHHSQKVNGLWHPQPSGEHQNKTWFLWKSSGLFCRQSSRGCGSIHVLSHLPPCHNSTVVSWVGTS